MNPDEHRPAFKIEGGQNIPQALSFMKDWVTAVTQLQTGALGGFGALFTFSTSKGLSDLEAVLLWLALSAFIYSIVCGSFVLNMLPGCAQRIPVDSTKDIYSMRTKGRLTLGFWARHFRYGFLIGISIFMVFVVVRTCPFQVACTAPDGSKCPEMAQGL